jgi:hypothetical protein
MTGDNIINLVSTSGRPHQCELLLVFSFEEKKYALLENLESSTTVVMQLVEQEDQAIFRTIEDDEEFECVTAHVKEIFGGAE